MAIVVSQYQRMGWEELPLSRSGHVAQVLGSPNLVLLREQEISAPWMGVKEGKLTAVKQGNSAYLLLWDKREDKGQWFSKWRRAFRISLSDTYAGLLDSMFDLLAENGVLPNEAPLVKIATDNFTYDVNADRQAMRFYEAESALYVEASGHKDWAGYLNAIMGTTRVMAIDRARGDTDERNVAYPMQKREVVRLVNEITDDLGMPRMDISTEALGPRVMAHCQSRWDRLIARPTETKITFAVETHPLRGTILHELAHGVINYECKIQASHGPLFILAYCELLGRYSNVSFEQAYEHFVNAGLSVADKAYRVL